TLVPPLPPGRPPRAAPRRGRHRHRHGRRRNAKLLLERLHESIQLEDRHPLDFLDEVLRRHRHFSVSLRASCVKNYSAGAAAAGAVSPVFDFCCSATCPITTTRLRIGPFKTVTRRLIGD